MAIIMFDVDGVLADFQLAFYEEARALDSTVDISCANHGAYWHDFETISKETVDKTWEKIQHTPGWWMKLKPLVDSSVFKRINAIHLEHTFYFVTSRVVAGQMPVQLQTKSWLQGHGIYAPCVITSSRKGEVAKAVNADFSIEDKWENAQCVHWFTDGATKSYLINRSYNQVGGVGSRNVVRVNTVEEYLDAIRKS